MKKFRPFLALLLACWLLAVPALADDEVGGDTSESPSVSDGVSGDTSGFEESGPSDSGEAPSSEETPLPEAPPSEDTPPEAEDPPPVETPPSDTEAPPPVTDPDPGETPVNPSPENPAPEAPADPAPETPAPETPADSETPVTPPAVVPDTSVEVPPPYVIPDAPVIPDGTLDVPMNTAPTVEEHQVFTLTTIPEFARAAMDSYSGSTMASVVRDLFGTYTPKVQTVSTYVDGEVVSTEEQYVPGVAGMDWEWIAGFAVFMLILYCLFRLLGGSVKYG